MEKRTRNPILGCIGGSIITMSKTLLNVYENVDNEIKNIDEIYKNGSEDDKKLIDELRNEERKLRKKLEYAKNSIKKQISTGNRPKNIKMQVKEIEEKELN